MQQGRPPKNCREAFTAEGDQVYPNRYYTSDFSMAKYLGADIETELRLETIFRPAINTSVIILHCNVRWK